MLFWSYFFYILVFWAGMPFGEIHCWIWLLCLREKKRPKRHFGIEHAVLGLFFVWNDSCVLAKIIPKQGTLEYEHVNWELVLVSDDPCVAVKITPKRQFRIEHAVLGFFLYISFWAGMPFGEIRSWIWLLRVRKKKPKKALWDRTCCFGLIFRLRWFFLHISKNNS